MPRKDHILNLPGFAIKKVISAFPLIMEVNYRRKARCVHCNGKKLRKKASFMREIKHEQIGHRTSILRFKAHKFYCYACERYFNQPFPGIGKYQRATERLHRQVYMQHSEGVSLKSVSNNFKLGKATIERWYHKEYVRRHQHQKNKPCPMVLGIDEHFFSKKEGFATTLCDLRRHKIFDVVKGRSSKDLESYLRHLPGKERVKVICIDLSPSYRSLIQRYFPHAKIVADRFHVVRLVNHFCMQAYQGVDSSLKYQRGLLALLKTKPDKLKPDKIRKRDDYLKQQPIIESIYYFKQRLHRLLIKKHCTAKQCRRLIPLFLNWIKQLKKGPFQSLMTLGKTLYQWREEIVRMWRFTKNNGITEGFHRKMKLIQRRAYGFKNFENYRLRVKVLCS